jgi:site-specific recombinase XerD
MTDLMISPTLTDWRADFRAQLQRGGKSANTIRAYQADLDHFSAWFTQVNGMDFSPELLTGVDLRAYREYSLEAKIAPASFNRRRIVLGMLASWAQAAGLLGYNPVSGVDPLPEQELAPRGLTVQETNRLMRQVERAIHAAQTGPARFQAIRNQAIISLMLYAGLREGEVCGLDLADIVISPRAGKVVVRRGKGDKRREVPLGAELRRALALYLEQRPQTAPASLFYGQRGDRLTGRTIQRMVESLRNQAGISECTPHTLRHTFAHRVKTDLVGAQKLLGHARLETTARYTLPTWDALAAAVENL